MSRPKAWLPRLVADVAKVIRRLKDEGTAVLLVEQNAAFAVKVADYVHVMSRGTIVHSSEPATLWKNEEHQDTISGSAGVKGRIHVTSPTEGNDFLCDGHGGRVAGRRRVGRPGSAGSETPDGGRGLQEHPRAQGHPRGRIHGDDGSVLRGAGDVLRGLSFGVGHHVGQLRPRHQPEKGDGASDGADDGVHQPGELRRTPGRDVLHLPSRQQEPQGDAESGGALRLDDDGRGGRRGQAGSRTAGS